MSYQNFIENKNIKKLYKTMSKKYKLKSSSTKRKQEVLDILQKNMKKVYKSLDYSKINSKNLNAVHKQFNNLCIEETDEELRNMDNDQSKQISQLKFKRDFSSKPKKKVKFMNRPTFTKSVNNERNIPQPREKKSENSSSLDRMFGMLMETNQNENSFNNVSHGKGNASRSLETLEAERNKLTPRNTPNQIPDFLKTRNSSGDVIDRQMQNRQMPNGQMPNRQMPNGQMQNNQNTLEQFSGLDDTGSNFSSINSGNEIYKPKETFDESTSFSDRLKKLQGERDNLSIPAKKNSSLSQNFENNNAQLSQNFENNNARSSQNNNINSNLVYNPNIEIGSNINNLQISDEDEYSTNITDIKNIKPNNLNGKNKDLLTKISSLEDEKSDLLSTCRELGVIVDKYKELQDNYNNLKNKKKSVDKEELNKEFKNLREQKEIISYNKSILNQRENELDQKEEEVKQLLQYYYLINQSKKIQVDIFSKEENGKYTYNFNKINNIQSIKLISYSLPNPRFNISDHNNILKYTIGNKQSSIKINNGNYNIGNLIETINSVCKDFNLTLNTNQKIELKSKKKIILENNLLISQVLGFRNNLSGKKFKSSHTWDLRKPDKLFLYIENIQKDIPVGILYFSEIYQCEVIFEDLINLEKLDIKITDDNGNIYNFSNLGHSLSFKFEVKMETDNIQLEYN